MVSDEPESRFTADELCSHEIPEETAEPLSLDSILSSNGSSRLILFDMLGHALYQYNFNEDSIHHQIDVSSFAPGIYLLEIRADSGRVFEKVMVLE